MKYARIERERRFLLTTPPPDLTLNGPYTCINDLYISNTRLRLRRMEDEQGKITALKLTQKFNPPEGVGLNTIITNIYLNEAEYKAVSCLQGKPLTKRRYKYPYTDRNFAIDIFKGALEGLLLCEIELNEESAVLFIDLPAFANREVTHDPFFTGGNLVNLTYKDIQKHELSTPH
jgi:CYTH domain-containing protein